MLFFMFFSSEYTIIKYNFNYSERSNQFLVWLISSQFAIDVIYFRLYSLLDCSSINVWIVYIFPISSQRLAHDLYVSRIVSGTNKKNSRETKISGIIILSLNWFRFLLKFCLVIFALLLVFDMNSSLTFILRISSVLLRFYLILIPKSILSTQTYYHPLITICLCFLSWNHTLWFAALYSETYFFVSFIYDLMKPDINKGINFLLSKKKPKTYLVINKEIENIKKENTTTNNERKDFILWKFHLRPWMQIYRQ